LQRTAKRRSNASNSASASFAVGTLRALGRTIVVTKATPPIQWTNATTWIAR
jgi:hypothetical protein